MNDRTPAERPPTGVDVVVTLAAMALALTGHRPLVDATVIGGLGVIAPLALGRSRWWTAAAVGTAVAFAMPAGRPAVSLLTPAGVAAILAVVRALRPVRTPVGLDDAVRTLAAGWAVVAVGALAASVAGRELFDIGEPIVRLTAVHFLYAGVGALTVARRLRAEADRPTPGSAPARPTVVSGTANVAVVATALAPPVVAVGFVLGAAAAQIGGAVLMTVGVWASALALLASTNRTPRPGRTLRVVAGLTPWVPMVLAVAWAIAQHVVGSPALSVADMGRWHGLANGVGFVLLGLLATGPVVDGGSERAPGMTGVDRAAEVTA